MKFKDKSTADEWQFAHPKLKEILQDGDAYMQEVYGIEICITDVSSTLAEDKVLGRVSSTHRDRPCRAGDVRNRDWTTAQRTAFREYLTKKYGHLGAVSSKSKKKVLVYDEDHGTGSHAHVQIMKGVPV